MVTLKTLWVYVAGPFAGGIGAGIFQHFNGWAQKRIAASAAISKSKPKKLIKIKKEKNKHKIEIKTNNNEEWAI